MNPLSEQTTKPQEERKYYSKEDVIAEICSPGFDIKSNRIDKAALTRGYIDCQKGTGFVGRYLYGVNVRTSDDLTNVRPFAASSQIVARISPAKEKTCPKFTDEYGIREVFFKVSVDNQSFPTDIEIITLVLDGRELTEDGKIQVRSASGEVIKEIPVQKIKDWLLDVDSASHNFLSANLSNIGIKSTVAYMWITSEDYYTGEFEFLSATSSSGPIKKNGQALSNILAISDNQDFLKNHIMSRRTDLLDLLFLLKARNLYDQNVQRLKASVKSAKAAIMSRNMSHNLGSHVMAYLKQHLYSVQDMIKDNVLDQILSPSDTDILSKILSPKMSIESLQTEINNWLLRIKNKVQKNGGDNVQEIALPFLVGLGKFISYLQERQDFIATIATDYNPYFSSVNFKDFIYDELNPDLRYERHKDRSGMRPDNILLGNIAKSEGLARVTGPTKDKEGAMSDIVLKYGSFDGHPAVKDSQEEKDLDAMRKIDVSLPGGVVGRQAVFSIIENVIRNAAKHGKWGGGKSHLELTIQYYNHPNKFKLANVKTPTEKPLQHYEYDRECGRWIVKKELNTYAFLNKYYSAASDIDEVAVFTITDNMWFETVVSHKDFVKYRDKYKGKENSRIRIPLIDAMKQRSQALNLTGLQRAILQRYVDNDGRMINENKGIKEMRISAAWLRALEDSPKYNPLNQDLFGNKDFFDEKSEKWLGVAPILMARPVYAGDYPSSIVVNGEEFPVTLEVYNLQIIFCLMKPKKVAVVTNRRSIKPLQNKLFKEYGWGIFTQEQFIDPSNKNRSYEFIIVDDLSENPVSYNMVRRVSHNRTFRFSELKEKVKNYKVYDEIEKVLASEVPSINRLNEIEVNLYKMLACVVNEEEKIRISDEKTKDKYSREDCPEPSRYVSVERGSSKEGDALCRFIYRKHHESDAEFSDFMNISPTPLCDFFDDSRFFPKQCVSFVEGITGNNSTDRLVRNEELSDRWYYAHLHAMKQKIAVFDERIFSKVYGKDEADIERSLKNSLKDHKQRYEYSTEDNYFRVFKKYENELSPQAILRIESCGDDAECSKILNDYLAELNEQNERLIPIDADKAALTNVMKGVFVFNIIKSNDCLRIYGFCGQRKIDDKWYSKIAEVGSISFNEKGDVAFVVNKEYQSKFDYISIHQGLLDKIYETLCIKNIAEKKHEVTDAIYRTLSYKNGNDVIDGVFLPGLLIHSGRSKPSIADMPQPQPFIQYAAIEHAILDCKYSLVELMDFARYEQHED